MPYTDVNGTRLYYEEHGSGDEIVVSAQMSFAEDGYPRCLAAHPWSYHVYQLTLRGHGPSGPPDINLGPGWWQQWADDVYSFIRQLGYPRVVYTGISHGAGLGWHLVLGYPEVIKAFVAVVGAPLPRVGTSDVRARRQQALGDPARMREVLASGYPPTQDPERLARREVLIERALQRFVTMDPAEAAIDPGPPLPLACSEAELEAFLGQVRAPTLLLASVQDAIVPLESSVRVARCVPGARVVLFQDEGHSLAGESPRKVAAQCGLFIDELNRSTEPLGVSTA